MASTIAFRLPLNARARRSRDSYAGFLNQDSINAL